MKYEDYLFPVWNFTLADLPSEKSMCENSFWCSFWTYNLKNAEQNWLWEDAQRRANECGHLGEIIFYNFYLFFRLWLLVILEMELGMCVMWTTRMVMGAASPVFITWIRTGTPRWVSHKAKAEHEEKLLQKQSFGEVSCFCKLWWTFEQLVHSSLLYILLLVFIATSWK